MKVLVLFFYVLSLFAYACSDDNTLEEIQPNTEHEIPNTEITALVTTEQVKYDTDDPAIWVNPEAPEQSLILGTDKNKDGGIYVFDLNGKILQDKVVRGLERPNNVDIEYGLMLNGAPVDIAVVTERNSHQLRIFRLPDMEPLDKGGIPVFEGEKGDDFQDPMGIAMYRNPESGKVYAIVGRKDGPKDGTYLWQYLLEDDGEGSIKATVVRKFGDYSGKKEIEAIAVDDKLGYVYYSDEEIGVRKYYADPDKGNEELALFASDDFAQDQEGISIYETTDSTGYILVSDQQNDRFQIFTREGADQDPHQHELVKIVNVDATQSDGSEVTNVSLNNEFKNGLFVAMSNDRTFRFYAWEEIAGKDLESAQ
ncbi:3-phytase [Pontibacter sp. HJ8]